MYDSAEEQAKLESVPMYWFNKANDLRGAAGALIYCMDNQKTEEIPEKLGLGKGYDMIAGTYRVYRMLCGMSLELAYKAVIVAMGEKAPSTHNLVSLAEKALINNDKKDIALLEILTECIIWEGRYPAPKAKSHESLEYLTYLTYENLFTKEKFGENGMLLKAKDPNPLDWEGFNKLWKNACNAFWFFHS